MREGFPGKVKFELGLEIGVRLGELERKLAARRCIPPSGNPLPGACFPKRCSTEFPLTAAQLRNLLGGDHARLPTLWALVNPAGILSQSPLHIRPLFAHLSLKLPFISTTETTTEHLPEPRGLLFSSLLLFQFFCSR